MGGISFLDKLPFVWDPSSSGHPQCVFPPGSSAFEEQNTVGSGSVTAEVSGNWVRCEERRLQKCTRRYRSVLKGKKV